MKKLKRFFYLMLVMAQIVAVITPLKAQDPCQASFEAIPDSTSLAPYAYHFKDLSTGNITSWNWDFGDGSSSSDQNPDHRYESPGTYQVCLTVTGANTGNCSDQLCKELQTLSYYSLGGLVYAGDLPINNPVNQGDTGIATLYRVVNQQLVYVEDAYFYDLGYYWFGYLFPDKYVVKISLTENSTHFDDYFTTYLGDDLTWPQADLLTINNMDMFQADIHLVSVKGTENGPGIIRGSVNFEQGNEYMPPLVQTTVILYSSTQEPLEFTRPDATGKFEFQNLPYGTYILKADATGKPSNAVTVTLTEGTPVTEGINLTVFGSNISNVPELIPDGLSITRIYPNPVADRLNLRIYSPGSSMARIMVTDALGNFCLSENKPLETGFNHIQLPVGQLAAGLYFVRIRVEGSPWPVTAKFIR
jgi:hypothetical protein